MKIIIGAVLALFISVNINAGEGTGQVELEYVGNWSSGDLVFFYTGAHTDKPDCNTHRSRWVLDLGSDLGKAQYSLLLAAQASSRNVRVRGTGSCSLWANSETANVVGYQVDYSKHP